VPLCCLDGISRGNGTRVRLNESGNSGQSPLQALFPLASAVKGSDPYFPISLFPEDYGLIDMAKKLLHNNQDRLAELASDKLKVPDGEKLKTKAASQVRHYPEPWNESEKESSSSGVSVVNFTSAPPEI